MSFRLTSIMVEDFRSIRGAQHISLDASAVLIHGPNGTGKTSLLSAIEFGLTGAVASLGRFDPAYMQHLPHKKSATGNCRVVLQADGLLNPSAEVVGDGAQAHGSGLLSKEQARFFTERCYLPQSSLGRLLEIYEHQDNRRSDSPLTRFVKELLGLEALDALIDGLHASGDVRRFREPAPTFWAARAGATTLAAAVRDAEQAVASLQSSLANFEGGLRQLLGDMVPPNTFLDRDALVPGVQAQIDQAESRLLELSRRRRDLAAAGQQLNKALAVDAAGERELTEATSSAAREALDAWRKNIGESLERLFSTIQTRFSELPDAASDPLATHSAAIRIVDTEIQRLQSLTENDAVAGVALSEVQEVLRQSNARTAAIEAELAQDKGANQELAQALTAISAHIEDETCPVCGRDFGEVSETPLAAHVSEEVQRLIAAAGRVQALIRDRAATVSTVAQAQRREGDLAAKRLSSEQRDIVKVDLARFTEWKTELTQLAKAASEGARLIREASSAARELSILNTRDAGVSGLRAELLQHAKAIGLPTPTADEPLGVLLSEIMDRSQHEEERAQHTKLRHSTARVQLDHLSELRQELAVAEAHLREVSGEQETTTLRREESERRIAVAKDLATRFRNQ